MHNRNGMKRIDSRIRHQAASTILANDLGTDRQVDPSGNHNKHNSNCADGHKETCRSISLKLFKVMKLGAINVNKVTKPNNIEGAYRLITKPIFPARLLNVAGLFFIFVSPYS
jgi:hypothetical protein